MIQAQQNCTQIPAIPDSDFDAEVKAKMREFVYILDADLPQLPDAKQWGGFHAYRNCTNEGLDKFHRWLDPFLAPGVAKLTSLKSVHEVGPHQTYGIVIALRRLIKTRKKNDLPHDDLLHALFGLCLMRDFACSFVVDGIPMPEPAVMVEFVDIDELRAVKCDYATVGYQHCGSLLKTDIKWLVAAFGEPVEHKSPDMLFQHVRNHAISRYCWAELRRLVLSANSVGVLPALSMRDWLEGNVKNSIASRKESEAWAVASAAQEEKMAKMVAAAQMATLGTYIVADLETTALNPETGEILELIAVHVDSAGAITEKFSTLIRVNQRVPTFITELTGIVQVDVDRDGRPLAEALADFFAFVGSRPIFTHNVQINAGFLKKAASQVDLNFTNPLHDISHIHQGDMSTGRTYKSSVSVTDAGATESSHGSFKAAGADLALLIAARVEARKKRNVIVPKKSQTGVLHWHPTGAFSVSVVGTSYYRDAIAKLVQNLPGERSLVSCTASFVPENSNIHDSNAVMVMIEGEKVGYLLRKYAVIFRSYFEKFGLTMQVTTCDALISNHIEEHGAQDTYRIALDLAKEPMAPTAIAPTYPIIERRELIPDPPLFLSKQDDGRYFVEVCLDDGIFNDMDRERRVMTWTTDHWDTINYYLCNKKNAGLGHLLLEVPKRTHKELFGDKEPDAKLEVVKGRMALVSLKPVA